MDWKAKVFPWLCAPLAVAAFDGAADSIAPDARRLQERVSAVHRAIGANDVESWYAATPPSMRRRMSLDDFKRDIRWDAVGAKAEPMPWRAEVGRLCSCTGNAERRCVVAIDLEIDDPKKGLVKDSPLESWTYEEGDWYLGYIGASYGGRCPGER